MAVIEALCEALLRVGVVRALVSACGKEAPPELREQAPPISPLYLPYISPRSPQYLAELREQAPHPKLNPLTEPYPLTPYHKPYVPNAFTLTPSLSPYPLARTRYPWPLTLAPPLTRRRAPWVTSPRTLSTRASRRHPRPHPDPNPNYP